MDEGNSTDCGHWTTNHRHERIALLDYWTQQIKSGLPTMGWNSLLGYILWGVPRSWARNSVILAGNMCGITLRHVSLVEKCWFK